MISKPQSNNDGDTPRPSSNQTKIVDIKAKQEAGEVRSEADAKERAKKIFYVATDAQSHDYLTNKGVKAYGIKQNEVSLIIPLCADDEIQSLQFILGDGREKFLDNGRIKGCYFPIGEPAEIIYICESYATGASIHEATGDGVVVAFQADNLSEVTQTFRAKYPDIKLVLCADDDASKANEAAKLVNGYVAIPDFGDNRPDKATDFNDLHKHHGIEEVKRNLDAHKLPTIDLNKAGDTSPLPEPLPNLPDVIPLKIEKITSIKDASQNMKRIKKQEQNMMATATSIAHYDGLKHYIDGIALQAHHTVIFGAAGSFKTTFITALCFKALKENIGLKVHYWGFDVPPTYIQAVVKLIKEFDLNDRFFLFADKTIADLQSYYGEYVDGEIRMDNIIIVLDTYKFITKDINSKLANTSAMHYIKKLCKLGASWVSLAHTNKYGQQNSGTAEIEQDSDGLLRIDSVIDDGKGIANIKKAGRCRFGDPNLTIETIIIPEDKSNQYLFWYQAIKHAHVIDNVDIEKLTTLKAQAASMKIIAEMIADFYKNNQLYIGKTELVKLIKENENLELSQSEIKRILNDGEGKYWKTRQDRNANNKLLFMPTG